MVFKTIKKLFPIKAKSLDEFMDFVEEHKASSVSGEYFNKPTSLIPTNTVIGIIDDFKYFSKLLSQTPSGRPIVFEKLQEIRFGSSKGFADNINRQKYALRGLLSVDEALTKIRQRLPSVKTQLLFKGEPMDDATYQQMPKYAEKYGVKALVI